MDNQKVSRMLIEVAGHFLQSPDNIEEMKMNVWLTIKAWNMSLYSGKKQKSMLKRFIDTQRPYAPTIEQLNALEWELRRIMKQRQKLFPSESRKIIFGEVIEKAKNDYLIRAAYSAKKTSVRI